LGPRNIVSAQSCDAKKKEIAAHSFIFIFSKPDYKKYVPKLVFLKLARPIFHTCSYLSPTMQPLK
jgi:hypothetical protein